MLGLPDLPTPAPSPAADGEQAPARGRRPREPAISGAQRGTLIHQLLATMDLRNPSLRDPMPADVRGLLAGLFGSTTFARLSGLREVRREQRFAFPIGETLITGVFDVIAQDRPDHLLVLDYKSDRLAGADPWEVVAERYLAQRTIYALAALKLGAPSVEVVHLFLEAPEDPVSAEFSVAEIPILEGDLAERVAGPLTGDFRVTDAPGRRICDGCPAQGGLCSYPLELSYPLTGSAAASLLIAEQRAWPAPALEDRIELGAVHRQLGAEMQPGQDAEDQRERAVGVARTA